MVCTMSGEKKMQFSKCFVHNMCFCLFICFICIMHTNLTGAAAMMLGSVSFVVHQHLDARKKTNKNLICDKWTKGKSPLRNCSLLALSKFHLCVCFFFLSSNEPITVDSARTWLKCEWLSVID